MDGPVRIGGQTYTARGGKVLVSLTPEAAVFNVPVAADLPGYQPFRTTYRLWANSSPVTVPVTPLPEQESPLWRRKVLTELGSLGGTGGGADEAAAGTGGG